MMSANLSPSRFTTALFTMVMIAAFGLHLQAQSKQGNKDTHYVDDWTHHHLVFSNPGTEDEAINKDWRDRWLHAHDRWLGIVSDPRFVTQQRKRSSGAKVFDHSRTQDEKSPADWRGDAWGWGDNANTPFGKKPPTKKTALKLDWLSAMITAGQVQPNMYPAKFSFSTTTASCSDFVVYPTGVAGATGAANIVGYWNLYTGGCSGTVPSIHWAYNTGTGYSVTTSPVVSNDSKGSQVAYIQSNGTTAQLVILKWTASTTQTLAAPGTLTVQSSASAYRSCAGGCFYSVSLGADDTYSAPYYDYDNDAIYVGDDTGKLHKITGVFNGTSIGEASGWPVTLNASNMVTSPVYDSTSGKVFVGDMGGYLYSVSASGTKIGTSNNLGDAIVDAPLVDSSAGKVYAFVTSDPVSAHSLTGCSLPYFSSTLTCTGSGTFTAADVGAAIASSNGTISGSTVTAYTSSTIVTISATNYGAGISGASVTLTPIGKNAVYQFATSFTTGTGSGANEIGTGGSGYYLYDGVFDNVYYSSTNGTAGDIWVMGNTGGPGGGSLYRIPITGTGAMGTPVAAISGLTNTTSGHYPWASPITEYCNQTSVSTPCGASGGSTTGGTDYLYFTVDRLQTATASCPASNGAGCLLGYSINTPTSAPALVGSSTFTTLGTPGCWTTGGIVIDNSVPSGTMAGASEIYFMALNGNSAGGPNGQTSSSCATASTSHTPSALQELQSNP